MAIVFKTEPVFKNITSEKLESPLLQSKKITIDKNGLTEILPDKGASAPKIKAQVESSKLRELLNNLPGDDV